MDCYTPSGRTWYGFTNHINFQWLMPRPSCFCRPIILCVPPISLRALMGNCVFHYLGEILFKFLWQGSSCNSYSIQLVCFRSVNGGHCSRIPFLYSTSCCLLSIFANPGMSVVHIPCFLLLCPTWSLQSQFAWAPLGIICDITIAIAMTYFVRATYWWHFTCMDIIWNAAVTQW